MTRASTLLWRGLVIGLFVVATLALKHAYDQRERVDTVRMLDASVSIRTLSHVTVDRYGDSVWETGGGSGFLVSSETCEVWTNHHVVAEAAIIEVFPSGWPHSTGISAEVVNSTPRSDIAIVRMAACDGMPEARLGDSDAVRPGDVTYAVGNPLGRHPDSISRGIISHTRRNLDGDIAYLQTDAAINPGSSGGALFNPDGEVIGINTAIARTRTGVNVGVGFAIPVNAAREVTSRLREGPPSWGDAGFSSISSTLEPEEAAVFRVPEGRAAIVLTETPGEGPGAGKLLARDVIYAIEGHGFSSLNEAERLVAGFDAGTEVEFSLMREGEPVSVSIVLGEGWDRSDTPLADHYDGVLGMTLEMWDEREGETAKFTTPVITKVHSLGPAHEAHISSSQHSMMVNGPFMKTYTFDVKTVTGVALDGRYHAIDDVDTLERFSLQAFEEGLPLLLEVEYWARSNLRDPTSDLEKKGTAYFRVEPRPADPSLLVEMRETLVAETFAPAYVH